MHHDGQIWSRALWDIRNALGPSTADTMILEAQFDFRHDDDRPREPDGAGRSGPVRLWCGDESQEGVPGPRHPLTRSASGSTSSRSSGRSSVASRLRGPRGGWSRFRRASSTRRCGARSSCARSREVLSEVTIDEEAVVRLADELDSDERREALRRSVEALSAVGLGSRAREAAEALLADDRLAWRCLAAGMLADELA